MTDRAGARTSTAPRAGPDAVPFGRYGAFLRRNGAIVVLALILGVSAGALRTAFTDRTYTSTVEIFAPAVALHSGASVTAILPATPATGDQDPPSESTMDTEAQLALSEKALAPLAKVRGFPADRVALRKRITVTVPAYTRVLTLQVRAADAKTARDGARALTRSYLALRKEIIAGIQARNRQAVARNLSLLRAELHAIDGKPTDIARLTARGRRQVITKQIGVMQRQLAQTEDRTLQSGEVVNSPEVPLRADDSRGDVGLSTGLGVGLLAGLLLGLIQDRRPRRIRTAADVRRVGALPVLAEARDRPDLLRDACRRLRNIIHEEQATTVLLTGVAEAPTEQVARMLASVCALGGTSTMLLRVGVDADENVVAGPAAGVNGANGAVESHRGADATEGVTVRTIPSGGDRQLSAAVRKARRESDLVVITGPPLHSSDTATFATICDLTFLTVELGRVSADELIWNTTYLAYTAAPARGLVLIDPANQRRRS
ncbi:hypothetical protein [Actinomadura sp. HBU206391]|uniref:hypothetical protein n=1 Tax=Actinomadura sp. HBU206391 TaxID=2731692 RepID=UPI00164F1CFF|nr:hypothetical protein [Actinomadura sp. HBU206391]MBC6459067.1 hypothetical protein [Actinomadura sp. HBU206391]